MKLYVGAWSEASTATRNICGQAGTGEAKGAPYQLPCGIGAEDLQGVAFAILADHLKDPGRAAALRGAFARAVDARLRGNFWTLRDSEIAEAIALIESGDRII